MKIKKILFGAAIAVAATVCLASCGSSDKKKDNKATTTTTAGATTTTAGATTTNKATTTVATTTVKTTTVVSTIDTPKLTLAFNTYGGNKIPAMQIPAGGDIVMPSDPVKEGYKFVGWYEDVLCEGKEFTGEIMPNRNITLYAKWVELANLTSPVGHVYSFIDLKFETSVTEENKDFLIEEMGLSPDTSVEDLEMILKGMFAVEYPTYTLYFMDETHFASSSDDSYDNVAEIVKDLNDTKENDLNEIAYAYTLDESRNLSVSLTPGGSKYLDMFDERIGRWYFEEGFGGLVLDQGAFRFVFPLLELE